MITLNLQTTNKEQEKVKNYLENNVSEILADKINNGVVINKDDKSLLNKKDLTGFMKFANEEARKQAEKGANCACIDDETVYGWAIHYFEEDSIEGTLYNDDGTEYKTVAPKQESKPVEKPKAKQKQDDMLSLFDMLDEQQNTDTEPLDEPETEEEQELEEVIEEPKTVAKRPSIYDIYVDLMNKYPDAIILARLGDFYEAFDECATKIAPLLDLTLTGRDFGLSERVPMVGFPYHVKEKYFDKITDCYNIAIYENEVENFIEMKHKTETITVDKETGEVLEDIKKTFDKETAIMLYNLLDGKMEIR